VYAVDLDQRIVFWNRGAERILGYTADEMLGVPCYKAFGGFSQETPAMCERSCRTVLLAREARIDSSYSFRVTAKNNEKRWIKVTHLLIPSKDPDVGTLVHIFYDVSEDVEAKQLITQLSRWLSTRSNLPPLPSSTGNDVLERLTQRELEVLRLVASGVTTEDIANGLAVTSNTVRNHIQRIMEKLGVHSRLEAVVFAQRRHLL
jgi:PAS domain S-box-containing protein